MAITIQNVLDRLMEPVGRIPNTVDTLKSGDSTLEVKGIATSFMATNYVIQRAINLGTNLLITHEGLYYSHQDRSDYLETDPVFIAKRQLIDESGLAIFRFHDYWHRYQPDGIMAGLLAQLGWQGYVVENQPAATILTIPSMKVREIADYVKGRLGLQFVRCAGDLTATCTRVGLSAGYRGGGALSIPLFEKENLDLIISGEGPEWETPEYVRDAVYQGRNKALIFLGHAESEEPGMKHLAEWLKTILPDIPIHFIPEKPSFQII